MSLTAEEVAWVAHLAGLDIDCIGATVRSVPGAAGRRDGVSGCAGGAVAGVVDGEILETLWSVLNEVSPSAQMATLASRTEMLDDHMLDSNWKKLLNIGDCH